MNIHGKRILITGGSSGIGLALAQALLVKGAKVVIAGRRADKLADAIDALETAGPIWSVAADVETPDGRVLTLAQALKALGGLDILIHNAGGVRAGRLENTTEYDIEAMVVNITSGIALIGVPFYATYAGVKAGQARFGEALRRELKGEGIHVLTAYPAATDTPMMASNHAGSDLGFSREPASAAADAIVSGIETNAFEGIQGGDARDQMIALNRDNPATIDERFLGLKLALENAVKDYAAL